jgi:hypothetical protein
VVRPRETRKWCRFVERHQPPASAGQVFLHGEHDTTRGGVDEADIAYDFDWSIDTSMYGLQGIVRPEQAKLAYDPSSINPE